jgi:NAD(P) transhydrogenase subunit beta
MNEIITYSKDIQFTIGQAILELSYLISAILFIIGLKLLSHPETARKGNLWAAAGMLLAMVFTLILHRNENGEAIHNWIPLFLSMGLATVLGLLISKKVKMTAMPQLVSFFNATGGLASAIIAFMEFQHLKEGNNGIVLVSLLGVFIGSISFTGSMIAYAKLDGKLGDIRSVFMKYMNLAMLAIIIVLITMVMISGVESPDAIPLLYAILAISMVYGVTFVMPIGGADMPVVISLLNSFTGIAAAMTGFLYSNNAMLLGGILVGSAGTILTILMCNAMNRSLLNVIIGSFGGGSGAQQGVEGNMKEINLSDAAILLAYSSNVVIVPGYGLAVSQAQHACHELDKLLEKKGVQLKYAIHPVAGRMPGHMNVLLAEADVPYSQLVEMDDINPEMEHTDVVIIIGANDVVNPAAKDNAGSPIYGMPIIEAYKAKNIIVMKRGAGKGYAGIENELFFNDKTRMLFGNAKDSLQKLTDEIKNL